MSLLMHHMKNKHSTYTCATQGPRATDGGDRIQNNGEEKGSKGNEETERKRAEGGEEETRGGGRGDEEVCVSA